MASGVLAKFNSLTKPEQILMGLPFLVLSLSLGLTLGGFHADMVHLFWCFPAFFAARTAGMAFNQVIDAAIDAKNPRTALRPVASGKISPRTAYNIAFLFLALFLFSAWQLGITVFLLSSLVALLITLYSFTKRFHWTCHFVLASIHFLSPVIAYVAVRGEVSSSIILLGSTAFFLIAASEINYATQDYAFDCKEKLHSVPVRFGLKRAKVIAIVLHFFCLLSSLLFGVTAHFGFIYYLAPLIIIVTILFFYLSKKGNHLTLQLNSMASLSLLLFSGIDFLWRALSLQ